MEITFLSPLRVPQDTQALLRRQGEWLPTCDGKDGLTGGLGLGVGDKTLAVPSGDSHSKSVLGLQGGLAEGPGELLQEPGPQPLRGAHFPEEGHHLPPPWSAKREQRQLLGGPGPYLMGSFMTLRVVTGITTLSLSEVTFPSLSFF